MQCALLAALMVAAGGGCGQFNWRGKGFDDNSGRWARTMRPAANEKSFSGLDARSREIEQDLGVR